VLESREIARTQPTMSRKGTEAGGEQAAARESGVAILAPLAKPFEIAQCLRVPGHDP
jgi:hypothetical protein